MGAEVSALFVRADGPYPRLVADCWDAERDATRYDGPNPVVAHPPCKRWGSFWWSDGSEAPGDDGGLFERCLEIVRRWGGVLEHPAASRAWPAFDLPAPPRSGWIRSLLRPSEWVTQVAQRNYGHKARKLTWLLYVGRHRSPPPALDWSTPSAPEAWVSTDRPRAELEALGIGMLTKRENELTPDPFARLLIEIAGCARV